MNKRKKEKIKRIVAIICALFVVAAFLVSIIAPAAFGASQKELDKAKTKTEDAKSDLDNAKKEHQDALEQYNAIDKMISDMEFEIETLEKQIEQTKNDITIKEEELKKAEAEYLEYQELFKVRARAMYENSEMDYLEILFGADDFGDFLSKMEIITQLLKYDQGILEKIKNIKITIENTKKELEDSLMRAEENVTTLADRRKNLVDVLATKKKLMEEAENNVERYKRIYEAAEAEEQALIRANSSALSSSANPVKYTGGKFAWPVPSTQRITSYYGNRIHPVYKVNKFHSGIDIGAAYGVDIIAAADGVVTLATTNGGYGKCIIINHGSGITTLYAHNSSLLVTQGSKVTRGQVIAKAGSTGVSTGPHLHYEVRINGATVNPLSYY